MELHLFSLSMAICMWAHTSGVPADTVDFIKFLTPQGYKSGYHCKCFKLFKLSQHSMLSPSPCASHAQITPNHMSVTAFTLLFSLILFLLYITPAISTSTSNPSCKLTPRGFTSIVLWNLFTAAFIDSFLSFLFSLRTYGRHFLCDLTTPQISAADFTVRLWDPLSDTDDAE